MSTLRNATERETLCQKDRGNDGKFWYLGFFPIGAGMVVFFLPSRGTSQHENKHMPYPNSNKINVQEKKTYIGLMCEHMGVESLQLWISFLPLNLIYKLSLAQIHKQKRKCLQAIYCMCSTVLKFRWHMYPLLAPSVFNITYWWLRLYSIVVKWDNGCAQQMLATENAGINATWYFVMGSQRKEA